MTLTTNIPNRATTITITITSDIALQHWRNKHHH